MGTNFRALKAELKDLRKEWFETWMDYSRAKREEIGRAMLDEYRSGVTIAELAERWGTKDRRTIMDFLEASGGYVVGAGNYAKAQKMRRDRKPLELGVNLEVVRDGDTVTVTTSDVEKILWATNADPQLGPTSTTWRFGVKVAGDSKLHAELLAGNAVLESLVLP